MLPLTVEHSAFVRGWCCRREKERERRMTGLLGSMRCALHAEAQRRTHAVLMHILLLRSVSCAAQSRPVLCLQATRRSFCPHFAALLYIPAGTGSGIVRLRSHTFVGAALHAGLIAHHPSWMTGEGPRVCMCMLCMGIITHALCDHIWYLQRAPKGAWSVIVIDSVFFPCSLPLSKPYKLNSPVHPARQHASSEGSAPPACCQLPAVPC